MLQKGDRYHYLNLRPEYAIPFLEHTLRGKCMYLVV